MKNIKDLRNELTKMFQEVKSKKTKLPEAKTLLQTANTIVKTVKTELDQNKFLNKKKAIDFLSSK
jgi:hypothetical protein